MFNLFKKMFFFGDFVFFEIDMYFYLLFGIDDGVKDIEDSFFFIV